MRPLPPILTDRTRAVERQRCGRAGWWAYEYRRRGLAPQRLSLPLAVGRAAHAGLAVLLAQEGVEAAVEAGQRDFDEILTVPAVEAGGSNGHVAESHSYEEDRAVVEALVRLYAAKRLPDLLAQFYVVSIEREYVRDLGKSVQIWPHDGQSRTELHTATRLPLHFMSRPDAVLLNRANHELEVLSFKTTGTWDARKQAAAQHDMQGLSESWAVEGWLAEQWHRLQAAPERSMDAMDRELVRFIAGHPYPPKVAAVRMEFLLRGDRRESEPGRWANQSPLIEVIGVRSAESGSNTPGHVTGPAANRTPCGRVNGIRMASAPGTAAGTGSPKTSSRLRSGGTWKLEA